MRFYSTNKKSPSTDFKDALLSGLASDGGLFMPEEFPALSKAFFANLDKYSFNDIALAVLRNFITDIPERDLKKIIADAYSPRAFTASENSPAPLVKLDKNLFILELFHGPTLSFKDFGARFMARMMNYYLTREKKNLNIIVATSGDTGSAVAHGFYGLSNIKVFVLYPKGRVTILQEKQMATLGKNIIVLEVKGDFDDCQALAKTALGDNELRQKINLSSANSINIGRLLPQMLYYFWAYGQLQKNLMTPTSILPRKKREEKGGGCTFIVPSGNFGNLTAGMFAHRLGLPVDKFIAAVNINSGVPEFLRTGVLPEHTTEQTISNAMDVGYPSNFARILDLYNYVELLSDRTITRHTIKLKSRIPELLNKDLKSLMITDKETKKTINKIYKKYNYIADPHTAVGIAAAEKISSRPRSSSRSPFIVLSTAHPAKFRETVEEAIGKPIKLPPALRACVGKKKNSFLTSSSYPAIREIFLRA